MTSVPGSTARAAVLDNAPLIRRVSRRELAENRHVWYATCGMFCLFALVTAASIAWSNTQDNDRLYAFLVATIVIAVVLLRSQPPAMDTVRNHALLALVYLAGVAALFAFQPDPQVAIGIAVFIGPLTAVRLQDRRAILAHLVAMSAAFYGSAIVGGLTHTLNTTSILAAILIVFGTWAMGTSSVVTLEAAEAQGDELERLVRRDALTGVGNRRLLTEYLEDALPRHDRTGKQLSLLALDLNGFKTLNDTVGHAAGDELLRVVAETLTASVRSRDVVVRQGGDEFCVVLPETTPDEARRTANTIRASLAKVDFEGQSVSSGIGIATYPDDAASAEVLLHLADQRLGQSKRD
ncbi:MAG: GGDEF domain-containing protein [Solirubrobacteraceae bacterium]|nr:GGDEF domain-containing protein [Patulibacter sp.]